MDRPVGIILTTLDDASTAKRLARGLVEANLASCVQVSAAGCSVYRWQDAVQEDAEHYLCIKTRTDRMQAVVAWLHANHPYDTPEIVTLRGEAEAAYADWLDDACRAPLEPADKPANKED